jgi:hypothetical protein
MLYHLLATLKAAVFYHLLATLKATVFYHYHLLVTLATLKAAVFFYRRLATPKALCSNTFSRHSRHCQITAV